MRAERLSGVHVRLGASRAGLAAGWMCLVLLLPAGAFAEAAAGPAEAPESAPGEPHAPGTRGSDENIADRFDPWQGIDQNGRIPKVELPPEIEKPERWRYIPEGRIKPGNIFQRLLVSSFIIPYVFRDGDIGTGAGIGVTDVDFRLQRRREFLGLFGSYTSKGQQSYGFTWFRWLKAMDLPGGGVILEERSNVGASAFYSKTLTRRYFGPGADAQAEDESSYTDQVVNLGVSTAFSLDKPLDDLVVGFGFNFQMHWLDDGEVSGVPSTQDAFPARFSAFEQWVIGRIISELSYDTRDSRRNPYRGHQIGARIDAGLAQTGGEVGAIFTLFGSQIIGVPGLFHRGGDPDEAHPPTDTIALGFFTQATAGTMPWYLQPTLGGSDTLRGYIDGRWRDRSAWHGSVEYRFWVIPRGIPITRSIRIERLGLAVFYEAGAVAADVPGIFESRPAQSYGVGGRLSLERAALFRLDCGFSEDGYNITAGFGLSF